MQETLTDLTEKQVINLCDGKILGNIVDFKIDVCTGCLTAIILPGEGGIFGFRKCTDIVIPWDKICKIGKDAIIVDIGSIVSDDCKEESCKKKKWFNL